MLNAIPIAVFSDTYKATHPLQYPPATEMTAYGEFRRGFNRDTTDTRLVHWGIRHIVDTYLLKQWTAEDVRNAEAFFSTHNAGGQPLPWPKRLFEQVVQQHDGYFPLKVQALPEGTCTHARVPTYQLTASGEFAPLCLFFETMLTQVWYPCTVATLSRRARDVLERAFEKGTPEGKDHPLLSSRLHDFGMRSCASGEQAVIGGCAHLLSFDGSDTMPAAYHAQFNLNDGHPIGSSIPATARDMQEHSVMTAWPRERDAIINMIEHFGEGTFAVVMDSYDYSAALQQVLPSVKSEKLSKGGYLVLRPDSGDPVDAVLQALHAGDSVFGTETNSKGYKVINGCGVIQGDGIDIDMMQRLSDAVLDAGFSPENVAYGMGGGLLHRVHRDTMSFATKLSSITSDGTTRDVMKSPSTDVSKTSFPGKLAVKRVDGVPTVFPAECVAPEDDMFQVVYDSGPVSLQHPSFDELRARVQSSWSQLPPHADPLSKELHERIQKARDNLRETNAEN